MRFLELGLRFGPFNLVLTALPLPAWLRRDALHRAVRQASVWKSLPAAPPSLRLAPRARLTAAAAPPLPRHALTRRASLRQGLDAVTKHPQVADSARAVRQVAGAIEGFSKTASAELRARGKVAARTATPFVQRAMRVTAREAGRLHRSAVRAIAKLRNRAKPNSENGKANGQYKPSGEYPPRPAWASNGKAANGHGAKAAPKPKVDELTHDPASWNAHNAVIPSTVVGE